MVQQFRKRACQVQQRLTQKNLLALLKDTPTFDFFNDMDPAIWEIVSFNPEDLIACITITIDSGLRDVAVKVPSIINTN